MILRKLRLLNFRNYAQLEISLSPATNFFCGDNAQGKSNLLEAIHCLSLTRSFRTLSDQELLRFGAESFEIAGEFIDERGTEHLLTIVYRRESGKQISLDRKLLSSHAALIGKFPSVTFTPESHRLTSGPPAERRRFLDVLLSQGSLLYLADLQEYNRVLRQRNALLAQCFGSHAHNADRTLAAWDESLALYGCKIIQARHQFVQDNRPVLQQAYAQISASSQTLQLAYRSQFDTLRIEEITPQRFLERLGELRVREKQRGQTLVGPQRDDMELSIGGMDLRRYGSRGEHKTAIMALKMMETKYLKQRLNTTPIILLDDLISELDENRARQCVQFFSGRGQLFVSAVSLISDLALQEAAKFRIQAGNVIGI
ncbi:MAG: DNA replication/repair protein RecF [candidate division KSB1 bacterium]|nr:DNA replication/repair protein RecF [candidate division KSB1 bacterium]MDZ7364514.1 DNA replication/repair protein RecF [candidate division KSB1 bacterium]MDZ7405783.1 DNA replication/repair protein RecF [candidate division KSB1 bacterium]